MPNRIEELASMRAPNQSGVDASAVIKALAGNPDTVATPTTYAYGMNVEDAQREGQLGAQNQARREDALQDARNAAMQQDQQRFDMAMKAHAQYMAERNLAVSERVAAAEIALKNARMRGIPDEIRRVQLDNEKLMLDIEREKYLDGLNIDIPDPLDSTKVKSVPARVIMSSGGRNLLYALNGRVPGESQSSREFKTLTQNYLKQGFTPEGAASLATTDTSRVFHQIITEIDDEVKQRTPKQLGLKANYGSRKDASGKDVPITLDEFKKQLYNDKLRYYFGSRLSPEDLERLGQLSFGEGFTRAAQYNESSGVSQESIDAITRALIEQYQ